MPLQLRFSAAAVQQLAAAWSNMVTIDLSGFGADLLPADAVAGFSQFKQLKHLTVVLAEGVLGAGVQQQQQQQGGVGQGQVHHKVAWWQLPKGLSSLCLSHFDLESSLESNSSSSNSREQCCCSSHGSSSSSCCCCMAPLPHAAQQQQAAQQQRQYSPSGFTSRVQQLISPSTSPLRPLGKRRQEQQNVQQQQPQQQLAGLLGLDPVAARQFSSSPASSSSSDAVDGSSSSSSSSRAEEETAAVVAAAAASSRAAAEGLATLQQLPHVCSCVAR
jgi:hypothetical protein